MSWWDDNYKRSDFRSWLTDQGSYSRSVVTGIAKRYRSVLDCASGTCLDYFRYQKDGVKIKYKGIDSCKGLVEEAKSFGIDCDLGDIEALPYEDGEYEVVTARHILEHLDYYEKAVSEMCRVAKYEVVVVFFLPPQNEEILEKDKALNYEVNINKYGKSKLEKYCSRFGNVEWIKVGTEVILRIKKRVEPKKVSIKDKKKIGIVGTLYIDNDTTYNQAIHTLDTTKSQHDLVFYARITKLDDKYKDILKRFDKVDKNDINCLARSWNMGTKQALKEGCDYVILPNLDLDLEPSTIDILVEYANKHKGKNLIWSGWGTSNLGRFPDWDFVVSSYTVYENFSFFMIDDRLFKEVGEFDEVFKPAYAEDVDMQYRLELKGFKHTCVYDAKFIHFGQTTQKNSIDFKDKRADAKANAIFVKKWGGEPRQQKFKSPYNGAVVDDLNNF